MITRYENGAEVEIESAYRFEDGAEQEAEAVYKYKDGAEEAVWEAIQRMSQMNNTLPSGTVAGYLQSDTYNGWAIVYFGGNSGGGSVTYYLEGDFTNPTISFEYVSREGAVPGIHVLERVSKSV